jgi:hypothetical protein
MIAVSVATWAVTIAPVRAQNSVGQHASTSATHDRFEGETDYQHQLQVMHPYDVQLEVAQWRDTVNDICPPGARVKNDDSMLVDESLTNTLAKILGQLKGLDPNPKHVCLSAKYHLEDALNTKLRQQEALGNHRVSDFEVSASKRMTDEENRSAPVDSTNGPAGSLSPASAGATQR